MHGDEDTHRREHLHFRTVNLQTVKRHGVRHKGNVRNISTSESEKETPQTPSRHLPTSQTEDDNTSITSDHELSLFPPIPDVEDQVHTSILFGTTMPDEIPIVSVHNSLPETEPTTMETTV